MSFHMKPFAPSRVARMAMAAMLVAATTACGDDGPNYPDVFDPAAIAEEIGGAGAAMNAPATESFAASGSLIDDAIAAIGVPLAVETPAQLLDGPLQMRELRSLMARMKRPAAALRTATPGGTTAQAIPAFALGKTFVYDPEAGAYEVSDVPGAPSNGTRFVLYAVDPVFGEPVEPLVETGHVDLTRTAGANSATARVEVFAAGVSNLKVLDYLARVAGSATSPRIELEGFATNGQDRVEFTLVTAFSFADDRVSLNWRTEVPTSDLVLRLEQSFIDDENPRFNIDAAVVSANGRIDLDGTVTDEEGGALVVKVNGEDFATMELATGEDEEPTILNADGEPLTEEEQSTLLQIFEWFAGAFIVFLALMAPMGTVLDAAF